MYQFVWIYVNTWKENEESPEELEIPKVFKHRKDAMELFNKRKDHLLKTLDPVTDIMTTYESRDYFSILTYNQGFYTFYVKRVKVK